MATHPVAPVPERLFDDEREQRFRARFTAPRMSRPGWARDAPDRCAYSSNAGGTTEIHVWDRAADVHRQVTDRRSGTHSAALPPDGEHVWWFADTDGDEFGHWVAEPFAGGGPVEPAVPGVEDGYPAGLEIGRRTVAAGTSTDDGTRIWLHRRDGGRGDAPARIVYAHAEDAGVGALSEDETLLAISHSEHGDSRHPAVRVLRVEDGSTVADKHDGPGRALSPIAFAPVAGDPRLLLLHERHGREELLVWDVLADTETELHLDLPGEVYADFTPDGAQLLVWHTHAARTRLHRYDLATGELAELPVAPGCVGSADTRPDGTVEYTCSSAAEPSTIRALHPDGTDRVLVTPPGERAPGSVPVQDLWVDGPGGRVHALVARPVDGDGRAVFSLHGGPHAADEDRFTAMRAAWVEAGFTVVEVNYRGSTGYGSVWRDAIEGRPGLTELEDVTAVLDACAAQGLVDPARCVVEGWSWGGYLALLAVGTQPERWAAGLAGVPVADYPTAYADEMEQLRSFDRALFGGSPEELPEAYRTASPLTYVDAVRVPVLVLAGENDPRCPIRQVDNYLDALAARGDAVYEVSRFDAGHGSLVVEQTIAHVATEIDFARRALARP